MTAGSKSAAREPDRVQAVELHRIAHGLEIRRHVLRHLRGAADEGVRSELHELMHRDESGDRDTILDDHVPGDLRSHSR